MHCLIFLWSLGFSVVHGLDIMTERTFVDLVSKMDIVLSRLDDMEVENKNLRNENRWLKNMMMQIDSRSKSQVKMIKYLRQEMMQMRTRMRQLGVNNKNDAMNDRQEEETTVTKETGNKGRDTSDPLPKMTSDHNRHIFGGITCRRSQSSKVKKLVLESGVSSTTPTPSVVSTRAAFSARCSKTMKGVGIYHLIWFDHVDVNVGGHYDARYGRFVCPLSGYYFFTVTITSIPGKEAHADIILKDSRLGGVYAESTAHGYNTASTSVVAHCNHGDHVWVKLLSRLEEVYGSFHSGFEGFMIWSD